MQFIIAFTNIYANVSYFSNIDNLGHRHTRHNCKCLAHNGSENIYHEFWIYARLRFNDIFSKFSFFDWNLKLLKLSREIAMVWKLEWHFRNDFTPFFSFYFCLSILWISVVDLSDCLIKYTTLALLSSCYVENEKCL